MVTRFATVARLGAGAAVATMLGLSSGAAYGQDPSSLLERTELNVEQWQGQVSTLQSGYLRLNVPPAASDLAQALADGRVRHMLGQFEEAAMILEPVVDDQRAASHPQYAEAAYFLADSYFQTRTYLRSRRYFQLVMSLRSSTRRTESVVRLIELARILDDYEGLEELYEELERNGDAGFAYQRGTALYFQQRYGEAINVFGSIRASEEKFGSARYFIGVCRTRLGEYDAALAVFDELLSATPPTEDLYALAALGKGRVYYEQADYASALDAYALVPRDSQRIGDALYEISWSFIQLDRLPQAVHQLRVMGLLDDPNGRSFPESQLLLGDVRLRMEEYDAAVAEFEAVSNRYLPVEQELDAVLADVQRESDLLARLIDAEQGTLPLPPLAEAWFESNDELDRAIGARQDVARMRDDIEFSRNEIARLEAALSEGSSVNILPGLRDGWRQGLALENASIAAWVQLVERERSLVESSLNGANRTEADRRREQRIVLQRRFEAMPRDFAAIDAREAGVISELSQISEETFRAQLELEDGLREVESLRRVLRQQVRTGERLSSSLAAEDDRLDTIEANLQREQSRLQALQQQINVRQIEVSVADDVARSERQIKRDLIAALQAESGALRVARGGGVQWTRFDGLYNELAQLNSTLESYFGDLDLAAAEETAEFRSALDAERARIDRLEEEVNGRDATSANMVDDVAQAALVDVRDRFGDISLRANLGIIDVAWRQKEDLTDSIEALFDERRQRLEVLEADFAEILAE